MAAYERVIFNKPLAIQASRPDLIDQEMEVLEEFGLA
jgi:hypothetical protein